MRTTLKIIKKMTFEEYCSSEYPKAECDNFGYGHYMEKELERWKKYDPEVYVCEADKKHNYGLNFKVYLRYKLPEGLIVFKPISFGGGAMTNQPFFTVHSLEFLEVLGEDNLNKLAANDPVLNRMEIIADTKNVYGRGEEARRLLSESGYTVCTNLHY